MNAAHRQALPGARWHFQHGPIDLVIAAEGEPAAVAAAHEAAWLRFRNVLSELVVELPVLRRAVAGRAGPGPTPAARADPDQTVAGRAGSGPQQATRRGASVAAIGACPLRGAIARRMWQACAPFADQFITPMAAVAGAVAQEIIGHYQRDGIRRAWVNNGGDIALHLAPGESTRIGLVADLSRAEAAISTHNPAGVRSATHSGNFGAGVSGRLALDGHLTIHADDAVRGVATSGWRGRSHSLGIADSVTVLAATAAQADAAATMIANAVDIADPCIRRRPACELRDDSDLGHRLVTVDVALLHPAQRDAALRAGAHCAQQFQARGLIVAAVLVCQGAMVETANESPIP